MELRAWLSERGMTVREFALELDVPLKTAQDWVYRGVAPCADNHDRLADFIFSRCAHHWVIVAPNGPTSEGVCQICGHRKDFQNSLPHSPFWRITTSSR